MRHYPALLRKDKTSDWSIEFPDFPGCVSAGKTVDQALLMGEDALALHVDGMIADKEAIPEPTSAEDLVRRKLLPGALLIFVPLKFGRGRFIRLSITLEERLLSDIDRAAELRGMTRSGFLAEASRHFMANMQPAPDAGLPPPQTAQVEDMGEQRARRRGKSRF